MMTKIVILGLVLYVCFKDQMLFLIKRERERELNALNKF